MIVAYIKLYTYIDVSYKANKSTDNNKVVNTAGYQMVTTDNPALW